MERNLSKHTKKLEVYSKTDFILKTD